MTETKEFHLYNVGIGDIFHYLSYILNSTSQGDEVLLNLKKINDAQFLFMEKFIKRVLFNRKIIFIPKVGGGAEMDDALRAERKIWEKESGESDDKSIIDNPISGNNYNKEHFRKIFSCDQLSLDEEYVVLFTRSRELGRHNYEKIKKDFFKTLKETNKKIVILGFQYESHPRCIDPQKYPDGTNDFFSIYKDILDLVPQDKVIDQSIPYTSSRSEYDHRKYFYDLEIIRNSKISISLGRGGLFCAALYLDRLLTWSPDHQGWGNEDKIFFSIENFLKSMHNLI